MQLVIEKDLLKEELLPLFESEGNELEILEHYLGIASMTILTPKYTTEEVMYFNKHRTMPDSIENNDIRFIIRKCPPNIYIEEIKEKPFLTEKIIESLPPFIRYNDDEFLHFFYWKNILQDYGFSSTVYISKKEPCIIDKLLLPFITFTSIKEYINNVLSKTLFYNQKWFSKNINIEMFYDTVFYDEDALKSEIIDVMYYRLKDILHCSQEEIFQNIKEIKIFNIAPTIDKLDFCNFQLDFYQEQSLFLSGEIGIGIEFSSELVSENFVDEDGFAQEVWDWDSYDTTVEVSIELNEKGEIIF